MSYKSGTKYRIQDHFGPPHLHVSESFGQQSMSQNDTIVIQWYVNKWPLVVPYLILCTLPC